MLAVLERIQILEQDTRDRMAEIVKEMVKAMHNRWIDLMAQVREIERDTPYRLQRRERDGRCYFKAIRADMEPDEIDTGPGTGRYIDKW